jgi:hypothetical protein
MVNIKYFFAYIIAGMFASAGLFCLCLFVYMLMNGKGGNIINWIPLLFVFTHGGVGIYGIRWLNRTITMKKWLLKHGKEVEVLFKTSKIVGTKSRSKMLVCTWIHPETHVLYDFESKYIRSLPQNLVPNQTTFKVLIDFEDPTRYWFVHQLNKI